MSYLDVRRYMVQAWLELPMLVDQFVQGVAQSIGCSQSQLREVVCDNLGLDEYAGLARVCRAMAEAYTLLSTAHDDMDVECTGSSQSQIGLVAAMVQTWQVSRAMAELQDIDSGDVEPMQTLPWEQWADWNRAEASHIALLGADDDEDDDEKEHRRKETAYELLASFMESAQEWRDDILTAYTMVREGTPVGLNAVDAAAELLESLPEGDGSVSERGLYTVLNARGFYNTLDGGLLKSLERTTTKAALKLGGWRLKRHKLLLERVERGDSTIPVRELRDHFRWLPPELVDGCYEQGPCMWQALAHLNEDAYVTVSGGGDDGGPQRNFCPFDTVYVERQEDIAGTLRCTGFGGAQMRVVSREEALQERLPQIAGWYAIKWWE